MKRIMLCFVILSLGVILSGCGTFSPPSADPSRRVNPTTTIRTSTMAPISPRFVVVVYYAAARDNDCRNDSKRYFREQILTRIGPGDEVTWISAHAAFSPEHDVHTVAVPALPAGMIQGMRLTPARDLLDQKRIQKRLSTAWRAALKKRENMVDLIGGEVKPDDYRGEKATPKPLLYALRLLGESSSSQKFLLVLGNTRPPQEIGTIANFNAAANLFTVYPSLQEFTEAKNSLTKAFSAEGAKQIYVLDKAQSIQGNTASDLLSNMGLDWSGVPTRAALPKGVGGE